MHNDLTVKGRFMKCNECSANLVRTSTHLVCPNGHGEIERMDIIWGGLQSEIKAKRSNTYKAQTCCLNCGWSGTLEKKKGERVKGTPCPNCECKLGMEE